MTRHIGYAKFGRSIPLDPAAYGPQGDAEAPQLLHRLANRNPDVRWYLIGKNSADGPLPPNVINIWPQDQPRALWLGRGTYFFCAFCKTQVADTRFNCCDKGRSARAYEEYIIELSKRLDGFVIHIGQHGTTNVSIPMVANSSEMTRPQAAFRNYCAYLVEALNASGDAHNGSVPVSWVCVDPRNYLKARDIKWPCGEDDILAQYTYMRPGKHERYNDMRTPQELGLIGRSDGAVWHTEQRYRQSGADMMILPDDWETWGKLEFLERKPLGIASTSSYVTKDEWRRSWLINKWVLERMPYTEVYGRWDGKSKEDVRNPAAVLSNSVAEFPELLGSWRATVSLPATARHVGGNEWCVAKPWQAFAARTACFFIPPTDGQGWVLPVRERKPGLKQVADDLWSIRDDWTEGDLALARWLRVKTPEELRERMHAVANRHDVWAWISGAQRALLTRRWDLHEIETNIERQLGLR